MQQTSNTVLDESIDTSELTQSERNRYFHGKLMTARDMAAEQIYHRRLFTRRSQHVVGYGVVDGLTADVERVDDELEVTVAPGYAIDCCGRPVVVPRETTVRIQEIPAGDPLGVYLEYAECVTESVPIPGSEEACERACAYNRVIETFEVSVQAIEDDDQLGKPVPTVEFPDPPAFDVGDVSLEAAAARAVEREELTEALHRARETGDDESFRSIERHLAEVDAELRSTDIEAELADITERDPTDPALASIAAGWKRDDQLPVGCPRGTTGTVFLGSFSLSNDTDTATVDPDTRPRVYTNDMLYSAIAHHTADFTNPHQVTAAQAGALVSLAGVSNPGGDVDLVSPDDNIQIEVDSTVVGDHAVGVSVPGLDTVTEDLATHTDDRENPHEVTAAQTGGLAAINGIEHAGGNVDLVSADNTVEIETNADDHEVAFSVTGLADLDEAVREHVEDHDNPHDVTAEQTGGIVAINEIERAGGNIDLVSPEGTVTIEELPDDGAVALEVPVITELADQLSDLEARVRALEEDGTDNGGVSDERVIRLEQHIMDRSLWTMTHAYRVAYERFRIQPALEIVNQTYAFIGQFEGEPIDQRQYVQFIGESLQVQDTVLESVPSAVFPSQREVLQMAFTGLQRIIRATSERDVLPVADAQTEVCDLLQGLVEREVIID